MTRKQKNNYKIAFSGDTIARKRCKSPKMANLEKVWPKKTAVSGEGKEGGAWQEV
jgi:hypothetical protein